MNSLNGSELLNGSDVSDLRKLNSRVLLLKLQALESSQTVSELAAASGLTRPTVEAGLAALMTEGWVRDKPPEEVRVRSGRPAKRYAFDVSRLVVAGVDLGPHGVTVDIADLRGNSLAFVHVDGLDLRDGASALSATSDTLHEALSSVGIPASKVSSATFGIPAVVSNAHDILLTTVVPEWVDFQLIPQLEALLPAAEVFVENDAKLAGIAEQEWGDARGRSNALCLIVGRRVAASVIAAGTLLRGSHGAAGEIGALASSRWESALQHLDSVDNDSALLFARVADGDDEAVTALNAFCRDLAEGIAALCLAIDPDVVILGGGIARAGARLLTALDVALKPLVLFSPELRLSSIERAVARGGVARSLQYIRTEVLGLPLGSGLQIGPAQT